MTLIINKLRPIFLYIALLNAGLYAGLHFTGMMNPLVFGIKNLNGEMMSAVEWARYWQMVDGFMRVRMEVFGPIMLWTYVITLLLFVRRWKSIVFWLLLAALGLLIADIAFTVNQQIPINRFIEKLDFNHLSNDQANTLAKMHPQVIENFKSREWFAIIAFVLVALCPFLYRYSELNPQPLPPKS